MNRTTRPNDAELLHQAINVLHETGMTPRELLERLRAAEKLLRGASDWMHVKRSRMPIAEIDSFLNLPADEH